jgi:hypothetical protein
MHHIWSQVRYNNAISLENGLLNTAGLGLPGLPCSLLSGAFGIPVTAAPTPNDCVVGTASTPNVPPSRLSETPHIYTMSLSHRCTRDLLVYVNTGTSFRPGVATAGIQGAITISTDTTLAELNIHPAEWSRSCETAARRARRPGRRAASASPELPR